MRIEVQRFHIQPTRSFPEGAPQREEFDSDDSFERYCALYSAEWLMEYECMDRNCKNPDCPQHYTVKG